MTTENMILRVASNYGNFATEMQATVGRDLNVATQELCKQGMLNILYRVSGSYVDKALGVDSKKGVSRKDVEYSIDRAETIATAVEEKLSELAESEGLEDLSLVFRVTGQHHFGEGTGSPMARASLFVDSLMAQESSEAQLRTMLGLLGLEDADDATRDEMVAFAHGKGLGMQTPKARKTA